MINLGCRCRSGEFYDDRSRICRTRKECPCYDSHSEQYIDPLHSISKGEPTRSKCICSNGSLQCTSVGSSSCGSNQVYSMRTSLCPRTCANYLSHYDCEQYGPGCTCPEGYILLDSTSDQSRCVQIDQCPCQYNGHTYTENESIIQKVRGCQNCTCQKGGLWSCKTVSCIETCTIFGPYNYQTFDGFYYEFTSLCQFILVQDKNNQFRILSQNIPCGKNGRLCSQHLLIEYQGVTIDMGRHRPIFANNIELKNHQIKPVSFGSIYIYQLGIYTMVKTDDFLVQWDGQTYIEIKLLSDKSVSGLCGNNNDNIDDDLISADGATNVPFDEAIQSWQTSIQCSTPANQTATVEDPCTDTPSHLQRRVWARDRCDLVKIKSIVVNNPFSLCIERMEAAVIEKYYQACLYAACR